MPRDSSAGQRRGTVLFLALLLVACVCLFVSLAAESARPPAADSANATRPEASAPTVSVSLPVLRQEAQVSAESDDVVIVVTDAQSGAKLDAVNVCIAGSQRTVEMKHLVALGATVGGVATLSIHRLRGLPDGARLALVHASHVPALLKVPEVPGVYSVELNKARLVSARVVTPDGRPVPHARVTFFSSNVERAAISSAPAPPSLEQSFSVGQGAWYVSTSSDVNGEAEAWIPDEKANVIADLFGWFPLAGNQEISRQDAAEATVILMEEVRCAVLAAHPEVVLGRSLLGGGPSRWREATNTFAFIARGRVVEELAKRYPGDIVLAECLYALPVASGRVVKSPQEDAGPLMRASVLVDKVGLVSLRVSLAPFSSVSMTNVAKDLRTRGPLGTLRVDGLQGYSNEWPAPFFAILENDDRLKVEFDIRYGQACDVVPGRYRIYQKSLGPNGKTEVGAFVVVAGEATTVSLNSVPVHWPVMLCVRDSLGSSPAFCTIKLIKQGRGEAALQLWQGSPLDSGNFVAHLSEGAYKALASCDGTKWEVTEFAVGPGWSSNIVKAVW